MFQCRKCNRYIFFHFPLGCCYFCLSSSFLPSCFLFFSFSFSCDETFMSASISQITRIRRLSIFYRYFPEAEPFLSSLSLNQSFLSVTFSFFPSFLFPPDFWVLRSSFLSFLLFFSLHPFLSLTSLLPARLSFVKSLPSTFL